MRSRRLATLALALAAHLAPGSRIVAFRGPRSKGPALAPGAALPLRAALAATLRVRSPLRRAEPSPEPRVSVRVSRRAPMPPIRRGEPSGLIPGAAIALTLRRREARALRLAHAARRARGVALALALAFALAFAIAAQGCAPLASSPQAIAPRTRPCAEIMRRAGVSRPSALCGPATVRVAR